MSSIREIEKALDEIFKGPERLRHTVYGQGEYGNKVIYKNNQKTKTWYFPYGETLSIQLVRNRIKGRRNVRSAF